uniref:Uncharacterized protein n=1 Tax=Anopheles melas TaxID=34690 RepID=A0A182U2K1_9DIPT
MSSEQSLLDQHRRLLVEHLHKVGQYAEVKRGRQDLAPVLPLAGRARQQPGPEPGLEKLHRLIVIDCTFAVSVDKQGIADDWQRGRAGDAVDVSHQAPIALQPHYQPILWSQHEITQQLHVLAPVHRLYAVLAQDGRDDGLLLQYRELLTDTVPRPGTERDVRVRVAPVAVLWQEVVRVELVRVGEHGRVAVQLIHHDHGGRARRYGVVVDPHILRQPPANHWYAGVQPKTLLDAALQIAHLVQLRHRWATVPILAHHRVDLLDDALLYVGRSAQQVQYPGHGSGRRVVAADDERIHLLPDGEVRQAGTLEQQVQKSELLFAVDAILQHAVVALSIAVVVVLV